MFLDLINQVNYNNCLVAHGLVRSCSCGPLPWPGVLEVVCAAHLGLADQPGPDCLTICCMTGLISVHLVGYY